MNVSIIIPAYNEEGTIGRCLKNLLDGDNSRNMEIIVVCNGCSDGTAAIARTFEPDVTVIELETGSKILALNTGDKAAQQYPRFYIDADIVIDQSTIFAVAEILESGDVLAAAPTMKIDTEHSSPLVKRYYRTWRKIPYSTNGMLGSGIYAASETGRKRFGEFPDVVGDDAYFRLQFHPEERQTVPDRFFTITAPKNLRWLIGITTRAVIGNIELRKKFPQLFVREEGGNNSAVFKRVFSGHEKADYLVYALIRILIKLNARRKLFFGTWKSWTHDPTSRSAVDEQER